MNIDRDMGWAVAYTLAAALLIFGIVNSDFLRALACDLGDKNCLREWVSALGGWAAVVVAVPTVVFLSRQNSIAQRQARDTFRIELRRSLALAENTRKAASELVTWSTLFANTPAFYINEEAWDLFRGNVADVRDTVNLEVFELFEKEIAFPKKFHLRFLRRRIAEFEQDYGRYVDAKIIYDDEILTKTVERWNLILAQAKHYGDECIRLSDDFIDDCQAVITAY